MSPSALPIVLLLSVAGLASASGMFVGEAAAADTSSCIAMSQLTSLSFQPTVTTGRRRGVNVPTMTCVGNCPPHLLLGAQCQQNGLSDNGLPSWRCVGNFQNTGNGAVMSLGAVRVICEGCTKPGDPNVRMNSCALQYSVNSFASRSRRHHGMNTYHHHNGEGDWVAFAFIFFSIVAITVACCVCARRQEAEVVVGYNPAYPGGHPAYPPMYGGGYYGGSGFGTGMMTGVLMGSAMSGGFGHHNHYYSSDDGGSYSGGGGGDWGSGGGGFGGSDSI